MRPCEKGKNNQHFNKCFHETIHKIKKNITDPNFSGSVSGNSTLFLLGLMIKKVIRDLAYAPRRVPDTPKLARTYQFPKWRVQHII